MAKLTADETKVIGMFYLLALIWYLTVLLL